MKKINLTNKAKKTGHAKNQLFLKSQGRILDQSNFEFYVSPQERCDLDLGNYTDLGFSKNSHD